MQLHDHEYKKLEPTHFLTIYSNDTHSNSAYMEMGQILKTDQGYKIGPSNPVSIDFLNDLAATIKSQNFKALRFNGLIPKNVLYYHSETEQPTVIWYKAKESQVLYFSKAIRKQTDVFEMPSMLFVCQKNTLSVYRLDSEELNIDQPLYMMPLPNICGDCKVCLGNNKMKKAKNLEDYISNMESLFYKTRFNALHHGKMGDGIIYTEAIKEKNFDLFPLITAPIKTLKKLLNEVS